MFKSQIAQINEDIKRTKRAIISIGCSFVQGHGAIEQDIYDRYKWHHDVTDSHTTWDLTSSEEKQLLDEYPDISINPGNTGINFSIHENSRSFVNILAKKYFDGKYTPINLGRSGCGNRAAIKELYFYPDILWNELEEIIVVYCPSGAERFDFMSDTSYILNDHNRWVCMWPNSNNTDNPRNTLWNGYKNAVHSSKFEVLEQIAHVQELMLWCKHMNARLIIVPSFQPVYTRKEFASRIQDTIERSHNGSIIKLGPRSTNNIEIYKMADMWPWANMFAPEGFDTWMGMIENLESTNAYFYDYKGRGSPNGWITPCAHPSVKSHDLFAKVLHQHIEELSK